MHLARQRSPFFCFVFLTSVCLWTHFAAPMMAEVMALAMEGVDAIRLDKSMKNFGWPVGAITLADEVGIDVAGHVAAFMQKVHAVYFCWRIIL